MDHTVVPGYSYAVTASEDCTLTAANGWKLVLKAGIQQHFTAQFDTFTAPVPITLNVNFNSAPAGSAAAGGLSEEDLVELGVLKTDIVVEFLQFEQFPSRKDSIRFFYGAFIKPPTTIKNVSAIELWGIDFNELREGLKLCVADLSSGASFVSEVVEFMGYESGYGIDRFKFSEPFDYPANSSLYVTADGVFPFPVVGVSYGNAENCSILETESSAQMQGVAPVLTFYKKEEHEETKPAVTALTVDATPTAGSENPVTSGGVYNALEQISGEQVSSIYVLEILGEMYLGDAWWEQEMSMEDGLVVYMQRLPEAGGESNFRGRLTLSEPRTASQLLAALTTRTGAASGEFLVYPVSVN